ncbi:hypothetical protein BH23ACT11_BH23ACT11_26010 [soil metagenome]
MGVYMTTEGSPGVSPPPSHSVLSLLGSVEKHRCALVLLASLELVGLLDEHDVPQREADRGRVDAEWGGMPAALGNSGAIWYAHAGEQ